MNKNLLKIYESFLDDLDQLNKNQDDGFDGVNRDIYNEHNYILSPDKNPEFFYGLCDMCEYYQIPYNKNGFLQEDLDKITFIKSDNDWISFFQDIISLDELQYFHNLKKIYFNSFGNCFKLKSVIFPETSNISLSKYAFANCIFKEIYIPKNVKKIDLEAFFNCNALEKVTIPKKFENSIRFIFIKFQSYTIFEDDLDITYI